MLDSKKKITLATVKKFIKENFKDLYINNTSTFDGMTDGSRSLNEGFKKAERTEENINNTLGVKFAWFVGSGRNYFSYFEENGFLGIRVYNSCDSFKLGIKK